MLFQNISKRKLKKEYMISSGTAKKNKKPRNLPQHSIWRGGLGILDINTQLNSLKIKWI